MFGKLMSEKQAGKMKVELFQRMDEKALHDGKDLDEIETLEEFFLTTTVNDTIISQCVVGEDEAKFFANYCETEEVNFVDGKENRN